MNFRKIYIKSGLFLIQMLLAFNFVYSQQYILEFKNTTESEKQTKKYKSYKDLILAIEDTLVLIKKQGLLLKSLLAMIYHLRLRSITF